MHLWPTVRLHASTLPHKRWLASILYVTYDPMCGGGGLGARRHPRSFCDPMCSGTIGFTTALTAYSASTHYAMICAKSGALRASVRSAVICAQLTRSRSTVQQFTPDSRAPGPLCAPSHYVTAAGPRPCCAFRSHRALSAGCWCSQFRCPGGGRHGKLPVSRSATNGLGAVSRAGQPRPRTVPTLTIMMLGGGRERERERGGWRGRMRWRWQERGWERSTVTTRT